MKSIILAATAIILVSTVVNAQTNPCDEGYKKPDEIVKELKQTKNYNYRNTVVNVKGDTNVTNLHVTIINGDTSKKADAPAGQTTSSNRDNSNVWSTGYPLFILLMLAIVGAVLYFLLHRRNAFRELNVKKTVREMGFNGGNLKYKRGKEKLSFTVFAPNATTLTLHQLQAQQQAQA